MFKSSDPIFEWLPIFGGVFGVGLVLFGLLVVGLIVAAIVAALLKRNSNTINIADGINDEEMQRIKRVLAEQEEKAKEAATREKLLAAFGSDESAATPTKKR